MAGKEPDHHDGKDEEGEVEEPSTKDRQSREQSKAMDMVTDNVRLPARLPAVPHHPPITNKRPRPSCAGAREAAR